MATIRELYKAKENLAFGDGGPDAAKVDANANIDQTPYSNGSTYAKLTNSGDGSVDENGIKTIENNPLSYSPGNRYGYKDAVLGGGYIEYKKFTDGSPRATWTDTKPYGKSPRV